MITVFRDCKGVIFVDVLPRGKKINSWSLCQDAEKAQETVWPHKNPTEILLQHENARLNTSFKTQKAITKFFWTVLPHPSYSPDLAPSDFHLFRALKDAIHSTKYNTDDNIIHIVKTWLCEQDNSWYQQYSEQNTERQALHCPVHFNHYQSCVQPFSLCIQQTQTLNKVHNPADRDVPKPPCFIKRWPRCLNLNVGKASATKNCEASLHLPHSRLFTRPSLNKCPFKWQSPFSNPVIILSWFLLRLNNSPSLITERF